MERWTTVKRLHQAALDREPSQRAAFLDEACAGDQALRGEVESLLAYQEAAEPFMESPALEVTARGANQVPSIPLEGRTLGHYQVTSLLGAGGMGEVYLASDPRLERAVALKILPPDLACDAGRMQRFVREARAASALNHPNVATIYDIGESDALHFIVMEYVEGHTLAQKIAERPLTVTEIVDIAVQVADALDAAHAKGITHRDIKPANLMLTLRGQVKVLDFGIAKTARAEESTRTEEMTTGSRTAVGLMIGSVPYMSPEQVRGQSVDHRSDLFSLGVTLYETATGRHPFASATTTKTMDRILHARPEPIAGLNAAVPSELERITFKCLEKDLGHRYQSARDLLADLRNLQRSDTGVAQIANGEHRRYNLPAPLTSFVGRRNEIAEIRRLFAATRLLTLTGAGGCGKTRLALQVASELLDEFRDGVWLVDLSPLSEPNLIVHTVAAIVGVREGPGRSLDNVLAEYFRARRALLVVDNCEHLIAACAQLVEPLLRVAPDLHVLATSREGLGVPGETVWRVPSLPVPAQSEWIDADALRQCDAVRLFADRASAVTPAFSITDGNAATVADICRRLDGIPLAIELAAARLNVLSVDQISVRLNDRFRLLTGGSRTGVARQRTLEATVDWSYDLLSKTEQRLLCRLSVFAGGWTLEAAEYVCSGIGGRKQTMLDLLSHLVDKSLVIADDDGGGGRRYRLLETVRQYGRERVVRSGDAERVRDRHLVFFADLVRRAEPELQKADQVAWLNRLQLEHDNLRAALDWCLTAPQRADQGLELTAALFWFWTKRSYLGEGRRWLERGLAAESRRSPALRAKALIELAHTVFLQGDYAGSKARSEESLSLAREAGDLWAVSWSLLMQALVAIMVGDFQQGARLATESQSAALAIGAVRLQGEAVEVLAYCAQERGDHGSASRLYEEGLALLRPTGDKWILGIALTDLATFRVAEGLHAQAKVLLAEVIVLNEELANMVGIASGLEILAAAEAASGQSVRAAQLWGASDGLFDSVGAASFYKSIRDRYFDTARESLGDTAFQAAIAKGRAMSLKHAIQYALEDKS